MFIPIDEKWHRALSKCQYHLFSQCMRSLNNKHISMNTHRPQIAASLRKEAAYFCHPE
jgi:hypothetical protein